MEQKPNKVRPAQECNLVVDIIKRFLAMTPEDRAQRDLAIVKDALYHVYWCGDARCETLWRDLIKDAGHDPSLEGICDAQLRNMILETMDRPMPIVIPRAPSGMFLDLDKTQSEE